MTTIYVVAIIALLGCDGYLLPLTAFLCAALEGIREGMTISATQEGKLIQRDRHT